MEVLASPAFSNEKVNPYNALLYREVADSNTNIQEYSHKKALLKKFSILHFHWPDGFINARSLLKSLQRCMVLAAIIIVVKLKNTKLVWTVHNVAPHDAYHPTLSRRFMNWFIRRCDGFIFMSEENRASFFSRYHPKPNCKTAIIPHGHYRHSYPAPIAQSRAKAQLHLSDDKKVLLFMGMIKPYKNIDTLITLFNASNLSNYQLVIVGNPDSPELRTQLQVLASSNPSIHLFLTFIPDSEIHFYLSAADAVILPYKAILNSGALLLALSFNKPVIAPHMGAIISLQTELGEAWVASYKGDITEQALTTSIDHLERSTRQAICPLDNYNWDKLGATTRSFYETLIH